MRRSGTSPKPSRGVVSSPTLSRLPRALSPLAWIRQATGTRWVPVKRWTRPSGWRQALLWLNYSTRVPAQRARLLLAQADVAAAARWAQEHGLSAADQPTYQSEREHLVLTRLLVAQRRASLALSLLDRLLAAAVSQCRIGSIIEIQALRSLALATAGDENVAVGVLAEAMTLARPQGYVRVFADAGAPMGTLLARLVAAQRAGQGAARAALRGRPITGTGSASSPHAPTLSWPGSARPPEQPDQPDLHAGSPPTHGPPGQRRSARQAGRGRCPRRWAERSARHCSSPRTSVVRFSRHTSARIPITHTARSSATKTHSAPRTSGGTPPSPCPAAREPGLAPAGASSGDHTHAIPWQGCGTCLRPAGTAPAWRLCR
jgi:hypothetical protein